MSVFKDTYTKSWACKFRYKNWQGETKQHKKTGFKTQKEAKEYEKNFLDKEGDNCGMTFQSMYEKYMEDCKARLRFRTVYEKGIVFETCILPYFAKLKLSEITPSTIRQWQSEMLKSERYQASTLKGIHSQLSAMFNYAVKFYGLRINPAKLAGNMGASSKKEMDYWTIGEFKKFISSCNGDIEAEALFTLLFYSGLRIGEATALTIGDFDFTTNMLTVDKNFTNAGGRKYIGPTKTPKGTRSIAIPQFVMNKVKEYYFQLFCKDESARIFIKHTVTYQKKLDKYASKAGVKRIRLHDLRHSHASLLINMGTPIKQIAERLGHEDVAITLKVYSHMYKEKEGELVVKLEALASGQTR